MCTKFTDVKIRKNNAWWDGEVQFIKTMMRHKCKHLKYLFSKPLDL